jgi:DNA-binding beta-propeller fold protein YncE
LAFSRCGQWLAVANHGNHSVSIFRRRHRIVSRDKLEYGPRPVTVIKDPGLRHPHSVAFCPETNHLVVTNSGANYFSVYAQTLGVLNLGWSQSPIAQKIVGPDALFQRVNARNKMEGGPKGIAIHQNSLAICSPEHGVKIYSYRFRNPELHSPANPSTST